MELEQFKVEVADHVATVTFDRPPVNAQNRRSREELTWIFDSLSDREDVRAVVLTGAGKVFSAGADIKERVGIQAEAGDYVRHNRLTRESFNAMAVGGYVQMPELDVGLAGGAKFLELFPKSKARLMFFTGRKVPAEELYRLGIVEACLPGDRLMAEAMAIAREIAAKSPIAVTKAKMAFNTVAQLPLRDGYRFEQGVTVELSRTEDAREAQRAFVEKRRPVFKGR
jgi:enoyl-CoA hydratase